MATLQQAVTVLKLLAINERIKSVCIGGAIGSGKSELLSLYRQLSERPQIVIPTHITVDLLYGGVSIEETLQQQKVVYEQSIFERAENGCLFVEQLERLEPMIARTIVKAIEEETITFTREQTIEKRISHTALYTIHTPFKQMSSTLLDCIGLSVSLDAPDKAQRVNVLKNNAMGNISEMQRQIKEARLRLSHVTVSEEMLIYIDHLLVQYGIFSIRAQYALLQAARALAAMQNEFEVAELHIQAVAPYVLNHRAAELHSNVESSAQKEAQENKEETYEQETEYEADSLEPTTRENDWQPNKQEISGERLEHPANNHETKNQAEDLNHSLESQSQQETDALVDVSAEEAGAITLNVEQSSQMKKSLSGKAAKLQINKKRGRQIGTMPYKKATADLDLLATLVKAIPEQRLYEKGKTAITVKPHHFVNKKREQKQAQHFIFVVDASQSMQQNKQMTIVKGVVLSLLKDAYQKRNVISFISMSQAKAEIQLQAVKNINLARKTLQNLKVGGKTPLASGLELSLSLLQNSEFPIDAAKLIVITDGRANMTLAGEKHVKQAMQEALAQAEQLRKLAAQVLVVDTEQGAVKLEKSKQLASVMQGHYIPFSEFSKLRTYHFLRKGDK